MSTNTSSTSLGSQVRVLHRPWVFPPLEAVEVSRGEENPAYHACRRTVSKSGFWCHYDEGPAAFHERYLARTLPPQESTALTHGTRLHRWLEVGDEEFWRGVSVAPESTLTATGLLGKDSKAWHAEHAPDLDLLSPQEAAQLRREIDALEADPQFRALQDSLEESELSIRFNVDGFPCRCRPDQICGGQVVDLKTTKERGLFRNFWRAVVNYGYHAQDWLYQRGMEAMGMEPRPLVFVVVSTTSAEVLICTLPEQLTAKGGEAIRSSIADIRLRLDLDCWLPDQHGEIVELPVPAHILGGN